VLRSPLIHPQLLAALGAAGHGARVLIADANYSHSTNANQGAALIHLNLRPGLVTVHQVLAPVPDAFPVEAAQVMQPDDGPEPTVFGAYRGAARAGAAAAALGPPRVLRYLPGTRPGGLRRHRRRPALRQRPADRRLPPAVALTRPPDRARRRTSPVPRRSPAAGPAGCPGRPLRSARHPGSPQRRSTATAACPTGTTTGRSAGRSHPAGLA
jgi:L-fucose mutarotase/ribose pyranase (RbsD/FucU family)